jgi:hypothetical protein
MLGMDGFPGGWLPWMSTSALDTLELAQNRNLRGITGQLGSTPNEAQRLEAGVISRVGRGLDTHKRLPLPDPTSAPWEWGRGH